MRKYKIIVSFLIFIFFFYIIIKENLIYSFLENIKQADKKLLVISFFIYTLVFVLRSLRLKIFEKDKNIHILFSIIGINTFLNNILPARLGEFSLPFLLKRKYQIRFLKGTLYLFILRIFDFISLFILFLFSFFIMIIQKDINYILLKKLVIALSFFSFFIIILLVITYLLFKHTRKIIFNLFIEKYIKNLEKEFLEIKRFLINFEKKRLLNLFLISINIWIFKFFTFYLIFKSLKYNFSYFETIFIVSFAEITTILPLHSLGGFGNFELGIIQGCYFLKIPIKNGLNIGFSLHLILLFFSFIVFIISILIFFFPKTEDINYQK